MPSTHSAPCPFPSFCILPRRVLYNKYLLYHTQISIQASSLFLLSQQHSYQFACRHSLKQQDVRMIFFGTTHAPLPSRPPLLFPYVHILIQRKYEDALEALWGTFPNPGSSVRTVDMIITTVWNRVLGTPSLYIQSSHHLFYLH